MVVHDLKLAEALEPVVPEDENVLGGFVDMRGPRVGTEVLEVPIYFVLRAITSSYLYPIPPLFVLTVAMSLRRTKVTIVRTDRNVLVIENRWRNKPRVGAKITRFPASAIGHALTGGDNRFRVNDKAFWVDGFNEDEAGRLAKMPGTLRP